MNTPGRLICSGLRGFLFVGKVFRCAVLFPLQRLYIRNYILNLTRFQHVFEWRHQLVSVFDPVLQAVVGNLIVVHGERPALGNSLQSRPDLLLVAGVVMADGALLLKQRFPAGHGRCICPARLLGGALRQ